MAGPADRRGYLNDARGADALEGISLFKRAHWFIKYRTMLAPVANPACEQRIQDAVAAMQANSDISINIQPTSNN